jgi:hypothetical protein
MRLLPVLTAAFLLQISSLAFSADTINLSEYKRVLCAVVPKEPLPLQDFEAEFKQNEDYIKASHEFLFKGEIYKLEATIDTTLSVYPTFRLKVSSPGENKNSIYARVTANKLEDSLGLANDKFEVFCSYVTY